jgi:hypothetical protein
VSAKPEYCKELVDWKGKLTRSTLLERSADIYIYIYIFMGYRPAADLQTANYVNWAPSRIDISYFGCQEAAKFQKSSQLKGQG